MTTKKNKSNNNKPKNNKNAPRRLDFLEDKTAERYFTNQFSKAEKLYEAGKYPEAIEILEPLLEKNKNRVNLLELLGISYASAGLLVEARQTFEQALAIAPGSLDLLSRFNLAQLYSMTGYNFLAYEQAKLIDCYELSKETKVAANFDRCREFKEDTERVINQIAGQNNIPLDEFIPFATALDMGRLALSKEQYGSARRYFTQAADLFPKIPVPFNNLALVCLLEGDVESGLYYSRHVLEKIDAQNRPAFSNIIRLLVADGQREEANQYLQKLSELPEPETAEDILKLAEAQAALDNDEAVLTQIQEILDDEVLLEDLDTAAYEEAITFGVIAAANLGQNATSLNILRQARRFTHPTLLERTIFALENNERGPRQGGRFFYYDPVSAYPVASAAFQQIAIDLDKKDSTDYRLGLQKFFQEHGQIGLEVAAYKYWIDRDPEIVAPLLRQAIEAGVTGGEELVRRLAFTRAGDDLQRITALSVLLDTGKVSPESKLKIWLGQRQAIGKLDELKEKYRQVAEAAQNPGPGYPPEIASLLNQALDQMRRGDREGAIQLYQRVLQRDPNVKHAYQNLAALLSGKGEMYSAIEYLQQALKIDPDYTFAQIALAQLQIGVNQLEAAEAQLENLQSKISLYYLDELEAYYGALVALYQKKQQPEKVQAVLEELLQIDPENEWAVGLLKK